MCLVDVREHRYRRVRASTYHGANDLTADGRGSLADRVVVPENLNLQKL
ncbi:hypothetical protein [Sandaracinus amylolyticus]|nr:hypothetical protein [Sandaracinus amylolyticus]UJR87233.1 Hypothetical protein I5071_240 [Sandaracinus amylolyticus]